MTAEQLSGVDRAAWQAKRAELDERRERRTDRRRFRKDPAAYLHDLETKLNQSRLRAYCNIGTVVSANGKPADDLAWYQKAIDTLRPVHQQEPRAVTARRFLRNSHMNRAISYNQLGKYADAVKDWEQVIELSDKPEQPKFRVDRANSTLRAGRVVEAMAEVAELAKSPSWPVDSWYDFAYLYSYASGKVADEKRIYADRAMEMLNKAVKAGYTDAVHMREDADLTPLRDRDDFKKLVAELEKKFPPKKETLPPQKPDK